MFEARTVCGPSSHAGGRPRASSAKPGLGAHREFTLEPSRAPTQNLSIFFDQYGDIILIKQISIMSPIKTPGLLDPGFLLPLPKAYGVVS
ncbi:MAG TPA: hypothetical protein DCL44_08480 [Elusimicrobia bacterium]|nr:hypothetical protein [Elusimicrobiota bacterium]